MKKGARGNTMKLQVALDFLELDEAMAITAEIIDYVDIVESGIHA